MNRRNFLILLALFATLLFVTESWATPSGVADPVTKQIAAPPADFALLTLPDPAQSGIRSRTAMIPVYLEAAADGSWTWAGELAIDASENVTIMAFSSRPGEWEMELQEPGGRQVAIRELARSGVSHQVGRLGMGDQGYEGDLYIFDRMAVGSWPVRVTAVAPYADRGDGPDGYLVVGSESPYQLYSHLTSHELLVGREIGVVAYAYEADSMGRDSTAVPGAPTILEGVIENVTMRLIGPDGAEETLSMVESGGLTDGAMGLFSASVITTLPGDYVIQVIAQGETPAGRPYMRTSEHVFPVIAPTVSLTNSTVRATANGDTRWTINLRGAALADTVDEINISAELWGTNKEGQMIPVVWLGGLVTPAQKGSGLTLPLNVDTRWIALAQANAPFELRNVRVQDINTYIPMARLDRLPMRAPWLAQNEIAGLTVDAITDEMLMGPAPVTLTEGPNITAVRRLMLVHGYCSNTVWPTSHFTNYAVFQDANQNRSHNHFAQLIRNYGNQFDSFGVVAHSQGGAASLHLYTYYWSGLDYSSGSRLIQSVGTPYRGTALAGNLAALGSVFGAGCGTNWDLTYDGASLWLSGIPSWARSRVYYSTTSFSWVWWRYDYCHLATDLFLTDPEDGTTEQWAGQLAGGNNMGHKTGWCHTNGMRDPAQFNDYNRNVNMNSHANR